MQIRKYSHLSPSTSKRQIGWSVNKKSTMMLFVQIWWLFTASFILAVITIVHLQWWLPHSEILLQHWAFCTKNDIISIPKCKKFEKSTTVFWGINAHFQMIRIFVCIEVLKLILMTDMFLTQTFFVQKSESVFDQCGSAAKVSKPFVWNITKSKRWQAVENKLLEIPFYTLKKY